MCWSSGRCGQQSVCIESYACRREQKQSFGSWMIEDANRLSRAAAHRKTLVSKNCWSFVLWWSLYLHFCFLYLMTVYHEQLIPWRRNCRYVVVARGKSLLVREALENVASRAGIDGFLTSSIFAYRSLRSSIRAFANRGSYHFLPASVF